jgi:hypothetical protein
MLDGTCLPCDGVLCWASAREGGEQNDEEEQRSKDIYLTLSHDMTQLHAYTWSVNNSGVGR